MLPPPSAALMNMAVPSHIFTDGGNPEADRPLAAELHPGRISAVRPFDVNVPGLAAPSGVTEHYPKSEGLFPTGRLHHFPSSRPSGQNSFPKRVVSGSTASGMDRESQFGWSFGGFGKNFSEIGKGPKGKQTILQPWD
jgi:hypothetical protein